LNINKNKSQIDPNVSVITAIKEQSNEFQSDKLGGNNMWQVINLPLNYIAANYPIKVTRCLSLFLK
jgi:RAB6A-GEF complex partner protein 1